MSFICTRSTYKKGKNMNTCEISIHDMHKLKKKHTESKGSSFNVVFHLRVMCTNVQCNLQHEATTLSPHSKFSTAPITDLSKMIRLDFRR